MKTIIAGSRSADSYEELCAAVAKSGFEITEVVSGGARGADRLGEEYADKNLIPMKIFLADWKLGRGAGHMKNWEMAQYGEALIALWDGQSRGTCNMIYEATKKGLKVYVHKI